MKLVDGVKGYNKEQIFERYVRLVENFKDYDKITKPKIIQEIINTLRNEEHIRSLCSHEELNMLEKIKNKENIDYEKNMSILLTLEEKCLLVDGILEFPDELKDTIINVLETRNEKEEKERDKINELAIGLVKAFGDIAEQFLVNLVSFLQDKDAEIIKKHLKDNKQFHYYAYESSKYIESLGLNIKEYIYQDYFDIIDEVDDRRSIYATGNAPQYNFDDYPNIFKYGLNINHPKVKKLYDVIMEKCKISDVLIKSILENALLYEERDAISFFFLSSCDIKEEEKDKYLEILNDALDNIPSGVLNGATAKEVEKLKLEELKQEEKKQRRNEEQINACLHPKDADLFYKLYFGLLEYTNNLYQVNKKLDKIYKATRLNPQDLIPIIEKVFENKEVINEFVEKNPYRFDKYELSLVSEFKKGIHVPLTVAYYEKEYTAMISDDGKTYMIKGVRANIDEIIDKDTLPTIVTTTLLPFKGNIIYDGIFSTYAVKIGVNFTNHVEEELENNMKYYHL